MHNDLTAHPPSPPVFLCPLLLLSSCSAQITYGTTAASKGFLYTTVCWPIALRYDSLLTGYRTHRAHHTTRWIVWHMLLSWIHLGLCLVSFHSLCYKSFDLQSWDLSELLSPLFPFVGFGCDRGSDSLLFSPTSLSLCYFCFLVFVWPGTLHTS